VPSGSNEAEAAAVEAEAATGWYVVYHNRLYDDVVLPEPDGPHATKAEASQLAKRYNGYRQRRYQAGVMHGTIERTGPDTSSLYLRTEAPAPPTPEQLAWRQVQEHLDAYGSAYIVRKPNGCYELQDPTQYKVVPHAL